MPREVRMRDVTNKQTNKVSNRYLLNSLYECVWWNIDSWMIIQTNVIKI